MTTASLDSTPEALVHLLRNGVSIWLDDLSRDRLTSGDLADKIRSRGVVGVTTNPSIFQAAITSSSAYADDLSALAAAGSDAEAAVRRLTVDDVRAACDVLADVATATDGVDGRVSLEVDPRLAHDTQATVAQARELWAEVDRANAAERFAGFEPQLRDRMIIQVRGNFLFVQVAHLFDSLSLFG